MIEVSRPVFPRISHRRHQLALQMLNAGESPCLIFGWNVEGAIARYEISCRSNPDKLRYFQLGKYDTLFIPNGMGVDYRNTGQTDVRYVMANSRVGEWPKECILHLLFPGRGEAVRAKVLGNLDLIAMLLHGRRGEVIGALLEDSTALRLPPHEA
jgi:hypothetical protein